MTPAGYDAWYDTPRGRWIGEREWSIVCNALALQSGDSVLDVGCGTGGFTWHAEPLADRAVGFDIDPALLDYARRQATSTAGFVLGDACELRFADAAFDKVMSIPTQCRDKTRAISPHVSEGPGPS